MALESAQVMTHTQHTEPELKNDHVITESIHIQTDILVVYNQTNVFHIQCLEI